MSPCIATVGSPCARSCRASESTARFVLTNTSVRPSGSSPLASSISFVSLSCEATGTNRWSASSTVLPSRLDLVAHRVARVHLGDAPDGAVERGREEHRLAVLRQPAHDAVDLRLEPHVEHAVGLVEHEDAHAVEPHHLALGEVVEPPGRGDQDVRVADPFGLLAHPRAAVDGLDLEASWPWRSRRTPRAPAVASSRVGTSTSASGVPRGLGVELLDDRDGEPERLARAGLRLRERVAARRGVLDHHHLDRERLVDAHAGQGLDDGSDTPRSRKDGTRSLICPAD